ncbi:hypothetical protein Ahy_A06g028384 [Arachis hypogaea]|uniref:Uncharacterized protein n=1 Tax=Arachis hypogaea TaxID=3818 RepID=A0A445CR07_ARAHY|nr:hypothetical protein Ahy_A06g028384 [Arachis hypogaea]
MEVKKRMAARLRHLGIRVKKILEDEKQTCIHTTTYAKKVSSENVEDGYALVVRCDLVWLVKSEDLRRDVKDLGELKKFMEQLTKASGNIERSLKVIEFMMYHNEDKCKDHDEYNTNLPPIDSVSNVDFTQQCVDRNPIITQIVDPPLRKRLRYSPA